MNVFPADSEKELSLPREIERFVASLAQVYKNNKQELPQRLLANAAVTLEEYSYDNLDGGQYGFLLHLQVPDTIFSEIINKKDKYEADIRQNLNSLISTPQEFVGAVSIEMRLVEDENWRETSGLLLHPRRHVSDQAQERIWKRGCVRAFLSHKVKCKSQAASLKDRLERYGVSCFVAHKDIQPAKEWVQEIESALFSMDLLVALLTDDFHDSDWTDQEVGVAVGRHVPIIPVRIGTDPYGFIGRYQALSGSWENVPEMASDIFDVIIKHPGTLTKVKDSTVNAFEGAESYERSKFLVREVLPHFDRLDDQYVEGIIAAFNKNSQLHDCFVAKSRLPSLLYEWTGNQYDIEGKKIVKRIQRTRRRRGTEEIPF